MANGLKRSNQKFRGKPGYEIGCMLREAVFEEGAWKCVR